MKLFHSALRRTVMLLALLVSLCLQSLALPAQLIPGGSAVGIKLYSDGLIVTELEDGLPAQQAGIRRGDVIVGMNGEAVCSAQALAQAVQGGDAVTLQIRRSERQAEYLLQPEQADGAFRIGVHLRDNVSGIGTVTYYDPLDGSFGALGHGVIAPVGSKLLPMTTGYLVKASVAEVHKGSSGVPGELCGAYDTECTLGTVTQNREHGIFGVIDDLPEQAAIPVAAADEVHTGKVKILTNVRGEQVEEFDAEIERLCFPSATGRDLLLHITDERLLSQTGGIVQGMSGSPIVQDGKLVGAVTHVLVSDPDTGYGTLIETMLSDAAETQTAPALSA